MRTEPIPAYKKSGVGTHWEAFNMERVELPGICDSFILGELLRVNPPISREHVRPTFWPRMTVARLLEVTRILRWATIEAAHDLLQVGEYAVES